MANDMMVMKKKLSQIVGALRRLALEAPLINAMCESYEDEEEESFEYKEEEESEYAGIGFCECILEDREPDDSYSCVVFTQSQKEKEESS